jgi:hypothetical protein
MKVLIAIARGGLITFRGLHAWSHIVEIRRGVRFESDAELDDFFCAYLSVS